MKDTRYTTEIKLFIQDFLWFAHTKVHMVI